MSRTSRDGSRLDWLPVAAVFASFFVFAAVQSPVPGVNEPHYLAKARHFWDPSWCPGDFFLDSSNAHYVFYWAIGGLTRWLSLAQTAWLGRVIALGLLAVGWCALLRRLLPERWSPLWTAWLFLLFAAVGNLSGEWIVGGVEAKVFAYGLGFLALALACDRRWIPAAACGGLGISFHPVVGGWGLVAAAGAVLWEWRHTRAESREPAVEGGAKSQESAARASDHQATRPPDAGHLPPAKAALPAALLILCALPGLLAAMSLLQTSLPPEKAMQADYIQVIVRLGHHLDPRRFPATGWAGYGALTAAWLIGRRWVPRSDAERFWFRFVAGSLAIAFAGLVLGLWPRPENFADTEAWLRFAWVLKLMKFYPFRLFDVTAPLAAAVVLVGLVQRTAVHRDSFSLFPVRFSAGRTGRGGEGERGRRGEEHTVATSSRPLAHSPPLPLFSRRGQWLTAWSLFAAAFAASLLISGENRYPDGTNAQRIADWRDACRWVARETPADVLFLTPVVYLRPNGKWYVASREGRAFKWYAQRPEFVSFKDCPQDAPGILKWYRRLTFIGDWMETRYADRRLSDRELRRLRGRTGITHVVLRRAYRVDAEPLYRNHTYAVYALPENAE